MPQEDRSRSPLASGLGLVAAVILAGVFLVSMWAKALDPAGFAEQMVRDGFLGAGLAFPAALAVIAVEGLVAVGLLTFRRVPLLLLATLMMLGFLGLALYQYFVPPEDPSSCGCFGNLIQQTPLQHVMSNAAFTVLALLSWLARGRGSLSAWRWAAPLVAGLACLGFAVAAPGLPLDDQATRLRVGEEVAALRIDEILPELQDADALVLLLDRADEKTRTEISRVNELVAMNPESRVQVFALAEENEELEMEFFWTAAPAFDVRGAPWGLLKPLYRTLPRAFVVRQGRIEKIWNAIPDDATLEALAGGENR